MPEYPISPRCDGHGEYGLVCGIRGTRSFSDGNRKGFLGDDMIATIHLAEPTDIQAIGVDALQNYASWNFFPVRAVFEVSGNGRDYTVLEEIENQIPINEKGELIRVFKTHQPADNMQLISVMLQRPGVCPPGHSGEGQKAWIFVSEAKAL